MKIIIFILLKLLELSFVVFLVYLANHWIDIVGPVCLGLVLLSFLGYCFYSVIKCNWWLAEDIYQKLKRKN